MSVRLHSRKAHVRHYRSGKIGYVCACVVTHDVGLNEPGKRWSTSCPHCGARIVTVKMPNGGWVRYEAERGMSRIKHACFNRGEGISKSRDGETIDLFLSKDSDATKS